MRKKTSRQAAVQIVSTLQKLGHTAYFAGGWVRDYLLKHKSDDIDIATSAHPEEVMRLFPRSIAVGVQFGVVRVRLCGHEFEVATFRSENQYVDGRRPTSVDLHSSPEEDAQRRDFTINGMFYDPIHHKIYDFVGGKKDLQAKILRTIGSPYERFKEDRLRIIRALRFKNVFHLSLEGTTWKAIVEECHHVVPSVSCERIWQELNKMLQKGVLSECLEDMKISGLLFHIFPFLKTLDPKILEGSLALLKMYKKNSLAAALCLLIPSGERESFAHQYKLSTKEKTIMRTFGHFELLLQKRPKDDIVVSLFGLPEAKTAFEAFVSTRKSPKSFVSRYQKKQKDLRFWIRQAKTGKYLLNGEDFLKLGIPPGRHMGTLIKKAFSLSSIHHIRKKEKLLSLMREKGFV